jgi:ABC transporter DrrB family efflux protein
MSTSTSPSTDSGTTGKGSSGHFQATHPDERGANAVRQISALIRRNLTHIKRQPEMLTDVTIQPVMFVLLFAFVFGGSIIIPGVDYKEWLLPGIMAQTMAFSAFIVAIGLTSDISKGIVDRFRSLPIGRGSVVIARSLSSLIHSMIGIVVMSVTGLFIGWGIHNGVAKGLLGYFLLILFGFSMIWVGILAGSSLKSVEAVQGVMFTTIFPITFLSNAFARPEGMPDWLRFLAEWNPISALVQAMRELWGNDGLPIGPNAAWPMQHPVIATILWSVGLSVVLAPMAIRAFNRRTTD